VALDPVVDQLSGFIRKSLNHQMMEALISGDHKEVMAGYNPRKNSTTKDNNN
jgi:hypothetical protein